MADGYELSLDIDVSALKQADNKIKDMITHTTELHRTMSQIFGNIDVAKLGMALGKVQTYFDDLSKSKVSPDVDTSKLEHLYDVMEKIVRSISNISSVAKDRQGFEFFDTNKVHITSDGLWEVERNIARINRELKDTKKQWDATFDLKVDKSKFHASINPQTGNPYKSGGKYNEEYAAWEQAEKDRLAAEGVNQRISLEAKRKALQEELKQVEAQAAFLRKTAAERTDYVIAQTQREVREQNKLVREHQQEYANVLAEMRKNQNQIAGFEKENIDGQNDARIKHLENRYIELNETRKRLEQDYGQFLVEIAEKHNADVLAIEAKRIKAKRQLQEEQWRREMETPEGALMSAEYAKTIDEMKQAQKNVLAARNKVNVDDKDTIDKLNTAYIKLRADIEELTKAEKNEQSLQPTIRNEYARLIRELDKLQEAKKGWADTMRYKSNDAEAQNARNNLIAREKDVQARIDAIKAGAGQKLDQEDRRFAAEKAQRELAETERLEAQKNAIRKKQWQEWNAYRQKYRTIDADTANRVLQSASQSKNVAQSARAIERLKNAIKHLNTEDEKYEETLKALNKEIEKHTHEIKMATDVSYRQRQEEKKHTTYDGALKYKEEARTLKDQIKAIEYLKIARQNLDRVALGESEYKRKMEKLNKEIRRSQREVNKLQEDFKNFNSKAGDLMGQLSRRITALFSLSAIENYVQKIASIRGEFEIQQRSLQVLIGSQEEANKIWEQTVALAVKSPFRVKELVTYTKQLAAYRIETEKLHDTTRMLADVSAGLGVDMNRLILAYGQVKAANYLRGTELRQFSEAGVNLLKDLADYFTAIEGRAVSVAQVFDRVSKRMVTFEHVDAIMRNITSEGGQFYKMQEKQSETLKGMLMNFQDSMDLMMDSIGKDYEGALKSSVAFAKMLVEQWRMLAPLVSIASAAALVFTARLIKAKMASISLVATLKSISWGGWLTMAGGVAYAIYQWVEAAQQFKKELRAVDKEMSKTLAEGLNMYQTLAEACNDATKSEKERHDAYVKLSTQFKEILPDQLLELEYVQGLAGNYKEVERAMQSYYNNKARQLKLDKIESKYGKDIQTDLDDLIGGVEDRLDDFQTVYGDKLLSDVKKNRLSMAFGAISTQVVEDIKKGEVEIKNLRSEIKRRWFDYFKGDNLAQEIINKLMPTINGKVVAASAQNIMFNFKELSDVLTDFSKQVDNIQGLPYESDAQSQAIMLLKDETAAVEELQQAYRKLTNLYVDRAKAPETGNGLTKSKYTNDISTILNELIEKYPQYTKLIENFQDGMLRVKNNVWGLLEFSQKFESEFVKRISDGFGLVTQVTSEYSDATAEEIQILVDQTKEKLTNLANDKAWTDGFKIGIEGIKKLAEQYNISLSDFANYMPKVEQTSADLAKQYDALADSFKQRREDLVSSMSVNFNQLSLAQAILSEKYTVEQLQILEDFWREVAKLYGHHEKDTTGGAGKDWFAEMGKAIRDTHKDFLILHKDLDKTRALELALEKHSDVFAEAAKGAKMLGLSLREFSSLLVEDNAIAALEDLLSRIPETASKSRLAIEKMIGELRGGEEVRQMQERYEELSNQIEKVFGTYELSLELKDMNIPTNIAERLFNFKSIDLSELRQKALDELGVINQEGTDAEIIERLKEGDVSKERIKLTEDTLKKISELEAKELEDRIKKFYKFLQDTSDAVKVAQDKGAFDIQFATELLNSGKLTVEQYRQAISKIIEDTNKEISKINLEKFKDSPEYIAAMGSMAGYTAQELTKLQTTIKDLIAKSSSTMQPEEIKAYNNALDKINDQLDRLKSPLSKTAISEIKEINRLTRKLNEEKEKQQKLEDKRSDLEHQSRMLTSKLMQQETQGAAQEEIDETISQIKETQEGIADVNGEINTTAGNIEDIGSKLQKLYGGTSKGWAKANKALTETFRAIDGAVQIFNEVKDLAESFGADVDTGAWAELSIIMEGISDMSQKFQSSWQSFISGDIAGGIVGAIGGIFSIIKMFNSIHDDKLEQQIKQQAKAIEDLNKAYEKLQEDLEVEYDMDAMTALTDDAISKLDEQIDAYESMIELEQEKKKTDQEKIDEYYEERENKIAEREALLAKQIQEAGGFGDKEAYKSAAEDFVDAWLSAYQETGNGLSGLDEQFDEFFNNMVKKQLLNRGMKEVLENFYSQFDGMFGADDESGAEATEAELKALKSTWDDIRIKADNVLHSITDVMGVSDDIRNKGGLGTLQKGIQGITEDQADVVAAFLNSLRFMVGEQNSYMQNIDTKCGDIDAPNTILGQLRLIADNTASIHKLLRSVTTATGHSQGGYGIKVIM